MVLFGAGIDVGLALLLAAVFISYAKIKVNTKAVSLITAGAVLYILAGVLAAVNLGFTMPALIDVIINIIGTIAVVIGAVWAAYSLLPLKK